MPDGPTWNIEPVSDRLASLLQTIVPEEPGKEYQQLQWRDIAGDREKPEVNDGN